ncbi:MAG: hypothetical protein V5A49_07150, partial [Haloarcula sp.]
TTGVEPDTYTHSVFTRDDGAFADITIEDAVDVPEETEDGTDDSTETEEPTEDGTDDSTETDDGTDDADNATEENETTEG